MKTIVCPECKKETEANKWKYEGSVSFDVTIIDSDFIEKRDDYATYFISHMQCPECDTEFELDNTIKIENYEDIENIYKRVSKMTLIAQ